VIGVEASSSFVETVGVPIAIALIGFAGVLAAAALSFALSRWSERTSRRRAGYAAATGQLVAFIEYPYRIRRRTSDAPDDLARLANLGHDLQESLQYYEAWVTAEHGWAGGVFRNVRSALAAEVGPACNDAWKTAPVASAAEMTLGGWGPNGAAEHVHRFERAVACRFGWRRWPAFFGWHLGA
jgi:hypothetical protein